MRAWRQKLWLLPRWRCSRRRMAARARPLVAVIIPVRNGAATLAETLRSLQAQTFPGWEAVIVDDGSSDTTPAVIAEFVAADRRFASLRLAGNGVSNARNRGVAAARAPWLMFLDADDWVAPGFLDHMLAALHADRAARVAYCGSLRVLPDGRSLAELPGQNMTYPRELLRSPVAVFSDYCPIAIHSVIVSREAFDDGGGFDVALSTSEDWDLWLRITRTGVKFVGVPLPLAFYRLQEGAPRRDPQRILRDAQQVVLQARRPDARMRRSDARFAAGDCYNDVVTATTALTMYFAGVSAGGGISPAELLVMQERWPDFSDERVARDAARDIEAGLAVGARRPHAALIECWQSIQPGVAEILAVLESHGSRAGAGARCLEILEEGLLRARDSRDACALRSVHGFEVALDAPLPLIVPAPHVDRVFLRVRVGDVVIDEFSAPGRMSLAPRDVARRLLVRWGAGACIDDVPDNRRGVATARAAWYVARDRYAQVRRPHRLMAAWAAARCSPRLLAQARLTTDDVYEEDASKAVALVERWRITVRTGVDALDADLPAKAGEARQAGAAGGRTAVPVLMYHSIAEQGPAALAQWRLHPRSFEQQLHYLRENDYYTVTSVDLLHLLRTGQPLGGKPVVLSFDDGYCDFERNAWPLLQRYDFRPEMFLVTDRVGGTADWDTRYGTPAPLMGWPEIRQLQRAGVTFGSHLATHRRPSQLTMDELIEEAARSRFAIEEQTGCPARSIAMPFGIYDRRVLAALEWSGYEIGYTVEDGVAAVGMNPLALPRIEVKGNDSLESFTARLQSL
jgi:peptidoglycan/xylan/chitin deacetylase (PgdA/CDA1 family)